MSEEEWLNATDAGLLRRAATQLVNERKLRLLACAYARHLLALAPHPDCSKFVEMAEQMADGIASPAAIERARSLHDSLGYVGDVIERSLSNVNGYVLAAAQSTLAADATRAAKWAFINLVDYEAEELGIESAECGLSPLRDIFSNPFRPVDFSAWRTDAAVALARQMYDSRDFGAMPILADALQEAGCDNADVLSHCRDTNAAHFRGCWVVDGVLELE